MSPFAQARAHYKDANRLLKEAESHADNAAAQQVCVQAAQVHATLALALATNPGVFLT